MVERKSKLKKGTREPEFGVTTVWLSTDMKNTVAVELPNVLPSDVASQILKTRMELFEMLLEKYGTKQEQGAKAYGKSPNNTPKKDSASKKGASINWQRCEKHDKWYNADKYQQCSICGRERIPEDYPEQSGVNAQTGF